MKINKKNYVSFDDFIQKQYDKFDYEYLFLGDIDYCDYVRYLFLPTINGEINGEPFLIEYDGSFSFKDLYYSNEYVVYAIQYLDNYVVEVVDSLNF